MQNFPPFSLFIIHRIMNSKFDAFLQPVIIAREWWRNLAEKKSLWMKNDAHFNLIKWKDSWNEPSSTNRQKNIEIWYKTINWVRIASATEQSFPLGVTSGLFGEVKVCRMNFDIKGSVWQTLELLDRVWNFHFSRQFIISFSDATTPLLPPVHSNSFS